MDQVEIGTPEAGKCDQITYLFYWHSIKGCLKSGPSSLLAERSPT